MNNDGDLLACLHLTNAQASVAVDKMGKNKRWNLMQLYKEMTVYLVRHWHTCRGEYCIERDAGEFILLVHSDMIHFDGPY